MVFPQLVAGIRC